MAKRSKVFRGDVHWVRLDPAIGAEVKKTRAAVIISNNAQNRVGLRVLAAPVTSRTSRVYSFEVAVNLRGKRCKVMLDQVRCLDQSRLLDRIGTLTAEEMRELEAALRVAFDLA